MNSETNPKNYSETSKLVQTEANQKQSKLWTFYGDTSKTGISSYFDKEELWEDLNDNKN